MSADQTQAAGKEVTAAACETPAAANGGVAGAAGAMPLQEIITDHTKPGEAKVVGAGEDKGVGRMPEVPHIPGDWNTLVDVGPYRIRVVYLVAAGVALLILVVLTIIILTMVEGKKVDDPKVGKSTPKAADKSSAKVGTETEKTTQSTADVYEVSTADVYTTTTTTPPTTTSATTSVAPDDATVTAAAVGG